MSSLLESPYFEQFSIPIWLISEVKKTQPLKVDKIDNNSSIEQKDKAKILLTCLIIEDKNNLNHQCYQKKEQYGLLVQMLEAIDLTPNDFHCINSEQQDINALLEQYQAKTILLLSTEINLISSNVFDCPHPEQILKNSKLKREAWEVLKKLKIIINEQK